MADIKISALPGASTLDGTETIPLVQGGTTKKVTTDQFLIKDASGNVGVGTASPSERLSVLSPLTGTTAGSNAVVGFRVNGSGRDAHIVMGDSVNASTRLGYLAGNMYFWTNGSERLRLDTAGNAGLGVTPSAWGAFAKALQILSRTSLSELSGYSYLNNNAYTDGGATTRYLATAAASQYIQGVGTHSWNIAASGTAGNPISFTQAMTLDASGNLLVNRASTSGLGKLNVDGGADFTNGNVYIGRDSGNLLVGAVAGSGSHTIQKDVGGLAGLTVRNLHASGQGVTVELTGTTGNYAYLAYSSGTPKFWVEGTGNVANANNVYGAISDAKLKENITDAGPKLAKLMQVRIVNYTLKSDPDKTKLIGVVAQELEQVSPGLIEETADRDADGNDLGTTTKSVKYSVFVPMLIKSLQEQQAQIEALEARLAAAGI